MDKATFWNLIDSTRREADGDLDEHVALLRARLQSIEPEGIVEFEKFFREYNLRAYTWDLWGAAFIIGGGCSDDGFMDFRGWLISKGEKTYENALKEPESLIEVTEEGDDCQHEGFQYVASEAFEAKTGRSMGSIAEPGLTYPQEPLGQPWTDDGDDLQRRFPKLYAKFS